MYISMKRVGIVLFWIAIVLFFIFYITPLIIPFLLGWLIAYAILPIVDQLESWTKLPRSIVILLSLFMIIVLLIWLVVLLFLFISKEFISFSQVLPLYFTQFLKFLEEYLPIDAFQDYYTQIQLWYGSLQDSTQSEIHGQMGDWLKIISDRGVHILQQLFAVLIRLMGFIPGVVSLVGISVLSAFFICKDYIRINTWLRSKVPDKLHLVVNKVFIDLKHAFFGFAKAHFTLTSITALITFIGLIILQVENALTISLIAGIVDLIPYLGTGTLFIPWILYLYFTSQFHLVIGLAILYACIIIVRQIIEPKILARSIGLHPLLALISIFVGLKLFGFVGMVVGPFALIFLQTLWRAYVFQSLWNYILLKK